MGNAVTIIVGAGAILNLDPHISFSDFSVPSALSLAESTSMIRPKGLTPSSIVRKRSS